MNNRSTLITAAALLAVGCAAAMRASAWEAPFVMTATAETTDMDEAVAKAESDRATAESDAAKAEADQDKAEADRDKVERELEAKLAAAQKKLEEATREIAELSVRMSKPLMDNFMLFGMEGPPRAVIGVQLDPNSGKDGARIQEVSPGGPAADAGLHVGDVIVAVNGTDVKGHEPARQVVHLMRDVEPDGKVKVRVMRDGKSQDFVVTARHSAAFAHIHVPRPPRPPGAPDMPFGDYAFQAPVIIAGPLGDMELATLTPQLGRYFGTDKGVLVVRAPKEAGFKLEDGDVILAIDGREPTSGSHATRILSSYQPGEKIAIKVMRDRKAMSIETTLPDRLAGRGAGGDGKVRLIRHHESDATT